MLHITMSSSGVSSVLHSTKTWCQRRTTQPQSFASHIMTNICSSCLAQLRKCGQDSRFWRTSLGDTVNQWLALLPQSRTRFSGPTEGLWVQTLHVVQCRLQLSSAYIFRLIIKSILPQNAIVRVCGDWSSVYSCYLRLSRKLQIVSFRATNKQSLDRRRLSSTPIEN